MTLTQILQKIRAAFYTRAEIDSMGGGASLDTTIRSKQNALSTAQLSAVNSGITSNKVSQYDEYINGASGQPVGTISWVMGSTVPAGYLICNGSAVSRTAYDKLFQAIGTKYGEGDGSTTFNLPNLIGKFLQGDVTSGTTGGEATHTLTIDEIPSHRHTSVQRHAGRDDDNFSGHIANAVASNDATPMQEQLYTDYTGGSMAHNNLPPYITSIPCIKAFDSVIDATTVSVAQLSDTKVNKDLSNLDENGRKVIADGNLTKSGWTKLANGLILQWGSHYHGDIAENSAHPISFNIPFPNDCLQVIVSTSETDKGEGIALRVGEPTTTGFSYVTYEWSAVWQSATVLWFAVGY